MTVYEMAKHYYQDYKPPLWDDSRIDALITAGKLTKEEAEQIRSGRN